MQIPDQHSHKIEDAVQKSVPSDFNGEFAEFSNIERRNHPAIIKVTLTPKQRKKEKKEEEEEEELKLNDSGKKKKKTHKTERKEKKKKHKNKNKKQNSVEELAYPFTKSAYILEYILIAYQLTN